MSEMTGHSTPQADCQSVFHAGERESAAAYSKSPDGPRWTLNRNGWNATSHFGKNCAHWPSSGRACVRTWPTVGRAAEIGTTTPCVA